MEFSNNKNEYRDIRFKVVLNESEFASVFSSYTILK